MNKKVWLRKVLVLASISLFVGAGVIPSMGETIVKKKSTHSISIGNTLYVGGSGPNNYTKIQDAVNDSSEDDTVYVYDDSAPYYENVKVEKSIKLIGEDKNTTLIDGGGNHNVVLISADRVTVSGFTIRNALNGIFLYHFFSNNNIKDNTISHNKYGIYLDSSDSNIIKGNTITLNNNVGIYLDYSNSNIITSNTISNNSYGMWISVSRFNIIKGNNIKSNGDGIQFRGGGLGIFILKNNFIDNVRDAFFQNSILIHWRQNYWNEPRVLPKLIFGELYWITGGIFNPKEHSIPWKPQIDWLPAKEPYDI